MQRMQWDPRQMSAMSGWITTKCGSTIWVCQSHWLETQTVLFDTLEIFGGTAWASQLAMQDRFHSCLPTWRVCAVSDRQALGAVDRGRGLSSLTSLFFQMLSCFLARVCIFSHVFPIIFFVKFRHPWWLHKKRAMLKLWGAWSNRHRDLHAMGLRKQKISSTREYVEYLLYVGPVEPVEPGHAKVQELATEVVEQQSAFQVQSQDITMRCSVVWQSLASRLLRGASLNNVCTTGAFYPPAQCWLLPTLIVRSCFHCRIAQTGWLEGAFDSLACGVVPCLISGEAGAAALRGLLLVVRGAAAWTWKGRTELVSDPPLMSILLSIFELPF